MSLAAFDAMKHVVATTETLNAHRSAALAIYAPLYVEAEKSVSALASVAEKEADRNAMFQARGCIKEIDEARQLTSIPEAGHIGDLCVQGLYDYLR